MVKPVVKKVMMGVPAVALSAALACTMAGCGGTEGGQGGSGDGTAATQAAYQSQSIDVEGFTVESLADGTYYRGDVYKAGRLLAAREDYEQQRQGHEALQLHHDRRPRWL